MKKKKKIVEWEYKRSQLSEKNVSRVRIEYISKKIVKE